MSHFQRHSPQTLNAEDLGSLDTSSGVNLRQLSGSTRVVENHRAVSLNSISRICDHEVLSREAERELARSIFDARTEIFELMGGQPAFASTVIKRAKDPQKISGMLRAESLASDRGESMIFEKAIKAGSEITSSTRREYLLKRLPQLELAQIEVEKSAAELGWSPGKRITAKARARNAEALINFREIFEPIVKEILSAPFVDAQFCKLEMRANGIQVLLHSRAEEEPRTHRRKILEETLALGMPLDRFVAELSGKLENYLELRDRMIAHNIKLVVKVARDPSFIRSSFTEEDRVQEGTIGLARAIEKFDYRRELKFSTYAVWWIRQAITRSQKDVADIVHTSLHAQMDLSKIRKHREWAAVRNLEHPTLNEIATGTGLPRNRVENAIEASRITRIQSLSAPLKGTDGLTLDERVTDLRAERFTDQLDLKELRKAIEAGLSTLPDRLADILRLRFGLDGSEEMSLDAIGQMYGLSRERIRQLEAKALERLRSPATAHRWKDVLD